MGSSVAVGRCLAVIRRIGAGLICFFRGRLFLCVQVPHHVYDGNGLDAGIGYGSGEVTQVDGTDVDWIQAQSGMNDAIVAWNTEHSDNPCNWRYAETDAETPPTLEPVNN